MKPSINLFPLMVVSWIMVIYLLATHNLSWYIWIFVAILIIERLLNALAMWLFGQAAKTMAQQIIKQVQEGTIGGPHVP